MKSLISTEMKTAAAAPAHWGKILYEEAYQLINNTMVSVITVQPTLNTLDSGINIGVRLLIFGVFSRATFLIFKISYV